MQTSEARLVLDRGVSSILYEKLASIIEILFNSLMERRVLSDFMILLEVRIGTVLKQYLY